MKDITDRLAHLVTQIVDVHKQATRLEEQWADLHRPRSICQWHEDYGEVLWWRFPVEEPPYVGTPLDTAFPGYHTHWTPLAIPDEPPTIEHAR